MGAVQTAPKHKRNESNMNVLHLLVSGGTGGIEILMNNYARRSAHNHIFVFVWKSGEIARQMERDGIPVRVTNAGEEGILTTLKRLRQLCLAEQADVVVSHNSAPLLKLALLYIKMTVPGIRTVAYAHANARDICEAGRKKGLLLRKTVHRLGFWSADRIVAISGSVQKSLREVLGVRPEKVTRIYNGTPVPAVPAACRGRKHPDRLELICVGRLIPEKGVQNILRALAAVHDGVPFALTVAGDGPYRAALEELAGSLGLGEQVRFLGCREDIPQLLARADVFLHFPEWEEGFGITVIEAMAAGLVCLVNDRGALPEVLGQSGGVILKAGGPEILARALEALWEAPEDVWIRLQTGAAERGKEFSLESFAGELDRLLTEVCGITE